MNNLKLAGILIALFTFTYFYQELGTQKHRAEEKMRTSLITTSEMGELLSIKGPLFSVQRNKMGNFVFANEESIGKNVDPRKIEKFFESLSGLRIVRRISTENIKGMKISDFVPVDSTSIRFNFTNNFINFQLGNKLSTDQSFYVNFMTKDGSKLVVVQDVTPLEGSYFKENFHRNDEKYRKIASLFLLTDDFFQKMNLLDEKRKDWQKISIMNLRKREFSLTISPISTIPTPLEGISYQQEQFENFLTSLEKLQAEEIYQRTATAHLSQFAGQITIERKDQSKTYLSLHQKYNNMSGYFVLIDDGNLIYKLNNPQARIFFSHFQDFWNRQPYYVAQVKSITLHDNKESYQIERSSGDKIEYLVQGQNSIQVNHRNMDKLMNFFSQASDKVSLYDKFDKELYPKSLFELTVDNTQYKVIKTQVELLLVDMQKQLKYHFYTGQEIPVAAYLQDYIVKARE